MTESDVVLEGTSLATDPIWRDAEVRRATGDDLPSISDLTETVFGRRRSLETLGWLLHNAHDPGQIDSWVVERRGVVRGHVAILKGRYRILRSGAEECELVGAHAVLWMVEANERGVGVLLGTKIVGYEDFLIVVGGTPTTQAILRGRGFRRPFRVQELRGPIAEIVGGAGDVVFAQDRLEEPEVKSSPRGGLVQNLARPTHLRWLAGCPELSSRLGSLVVAGRVLGPVLLLAEGDGGRIAHLPYLGEDAEVWRGALVACALALAEMGCSFLSVLVSEPALLDAWSDVGLETFRSRPVWVRGPAHLLDVERWHLSYLEGDLAYRGIAAAGEGMGAHR